MRKFLLLSISFAISISSYCQDFSNKGKDFWVGYGSHVSMYAANGSLIASGGSQEMVLYFTSDVQANVTVTIPATGWTRSYTIIPPPVGTGLVETQTIPKTGTDDARLGSEQKYLKKGIHITSDKPIVAYAHIYNGSISGATLLFPTNTLGKEYYSLNYKQNSNAPYSYPYTFVIATEDSTIIQTTTTANTQTRTAGVMKTDTLMQGDVLNLLGQLITNTTNSSTGVELTGTKIKSVATATGQCKKIAVFSGSGKIGIVCPAGTGGSADNYIQQCFPSTAWGKKYYTVPTKDLPFNYFRIMVKDPLTVVKLNGVVQAGIINNTYYDLPLTNVPNFIEADQPVMVAQMITTQGSCGNGSPGDPEMIYLSSIEQTIDNVTLNSTTHAAITKHYINVIIRSGGVASFRLDNAVPATAFTVHPQDANYVYAQFAVSAGVHQLRSDSGFSAIAYGYGPTESYGYNAGTNIRDLYTFLTPLNPLNITNQTAACSGTPFYFSVTYPFQPLSLYWNFNGAMGYPNVSVTNPASINDSAYIINGRQVWRYKLPTPYTYSPAGAYPVTLTAETSGSDGCGNFQVRDDTLYVFDPEVSVIGSQSTGCAADSIAFFDNTVYPTGSGLYNYQWQWNFGDPASGANNTSTLKNPKHKFSAAGTYAVTLTGLDNIGCFTSPSTKQISVTEIPTAKFGMSSPICAGLPVTFSDTSTLVAPGSIVKWHWNFGDGFTTIRNNSNDTTHIYSPWNANLTDTLTVETNTGCKSLPFYRNFKVNPIPVSNFTLPAGVCLPWDSAHFISTSTIADGTTGFGYLWHFGDVASGTNDSSFLQNPAHHYNNVGPFSINLKITSAAGCVHDTTKILSNIYPQAIAGFTVNTENCLNDVTSFASSSNGNGNTITEYHWDFGDGSPDINTANPTHTYATAGIKTIKHWIKTNVSCYSDTAVKSVTINPLPTANFSYNTPNCETRTIVFTDASVPNAGTLATWQWDFGDGTAIDNAQSPTHIFANAGSYNVKLTVTTSKGCVNFIIKTVVINARPLAGFITPEVCLSDTYAQFLDTSKVALPSNVSGWQWNFGDPFATAPNPNTSILQNPTHSYTAVGPYNIQLIATSNAGCRDTLNQTLTVNGSFPVANFTVNNSASLCANDSVAIVEASTVFPGVITKVEIYWDNINFPAALQLDNTPFTGKVYKHLYLPNSQVTKNYQIRYRAYSGGVCVNDKLSAITVNAAPKVQFAAIPAICYDAAPYLITQGTEVGAVPGTFAYSGPGIVNSNGLFNPAIAGVGTHTIKYTYISFAASCVDTISQTIKVIDTASSRFVFTGPDCDGTPANFRDISTAPAGVVLNNTVWNFGDGSPLENHAPGSSFTHLFPAWGTYTVTMYSTSAYGCKAAATQQQVYISPIPAAAFSFVQNSVCLPNATISFNNTSAIADGTENTFTYLWNLGDLNNSTAKIPPPHLYSSTGPFTVTLKVTSGNNCSNTISHLIDFIHPQPKAAFSFNKPEVCIGDAVTFKDITNGLDGAVTKWNWDFGDGLKGSNAVELHLYAAASTFNVSLFIINSQGCNSDTLTKQFTVHPYPVVDAGPDRWVLEGGTITIQPAVTGNDLKYLWSPSTYLVNAAIETPSAVDVLNDITYTLTVTARGGCTRSDNMFVKVLRAPKIPNTFTPNGDGMNELWEIQYLDSYPDNRVQVFTRTGQLVFESRGYRKPWDGKINSKALPVDTYYYIIEPGNGRTPITGFVTIIK